MLNKFKLSFVVGLWMISLISYGQCNLQKVFEDELYSSKELFELMAKDANLVDSWKILFNSNSSLRNINNIQILDAYKKANPGLSDEAIKTAIDGLKASRKQSFINGLKNVANNDQLLSMTNKRVASVDEVKDAVNNMRDFRKNNPSIPSNKNIGTLEGSIDGTPTNQLSSNQKWISGTDDTPLAVDEVWPAQNATGSNGGSWLRDIDSEYKMLNDLARKLEPNAKVGDIFSSHTGEIKIISEIPYCTSCAGIIQDFNQMFPNIKVVLIDGIK